MNSDHTVYDMYTSTDIIEAYRITATQLRLSSRNLAVEHGRWSRQPREERLCECGAIQDEQHMAAYCPSTRHVRASHQQTNFTLPALFGEVPVPQMIHLIHELFANFV